MITVCLFSMMGAGRVIGKEGEKGRGLVDPIFRPHGTAAMRGGGDEDAAGERPPVGTRDLRRDRHGRYTQFPHKLGGIQVSPKPPHARSNFGAWTILFGINKGPMEISLNVLPGISFLDFGPGP